MFDTQSAAQEVAAIRADYVDRVLTTKVNRREGDFTIEEINAWEKAAYRTWIDAHPTLNSLLGAHLPEHLPTSPETNAEEAK